MKFSPGQILCTARMSKDMEDPVFSKEISNALGRYFLADFSDMEYEEDIEENDRAIETGMERIFASYNTSKGKIYIITEWDRSITTILYPDEY